ncbi:hypothetical protein N657DRAFT_673996 [Parathielavia appendiculata]|uniref:MINDY deubiquitinase domain-containing protein n=1 Tax=Parathielavia appendiculata TaxID=2587402 RepID=A0AAN6TVV5_9PEZI|nr:hypothetical protein N657DRAFT_673996 [Parathielavia appendiculata]
MVIRKPIPSSATLDPAVPQKARGAKNTEEETIWRDGAQRQEGELNSTYPAPAEVSNSLLPGAASNVFGLGEESNIWAEEVPALSNAGDTSQASPVLRSGSSHGKGADTSQGTRADQEPNSVPAALRPGGGSKPETNPFKRKTSLSVGAGQRTSTPSSNAPHVPPVSVAEFSQLSPAMDEIKATPAPPPVPRLPEQDSVGDNVWASAEPSRQPTPGPASDSPALLSLPPEEGSAGWAEESKDATVSPPLISTADEDVLEGGNAWDDLEAVDKGKGIAQPPPVPDKSAAGAADWNLIDIDARPGPPSRQSSWESFEAEDNAPAAAKTVPARGEAATLPPQLPPRRSADQPPPKPRRPVDKSETYQIKNINWYDATATKNPRTSPILVQNANGPCPLVALVNALTLTTPADKTNTALVETLKSREQVSLGLLLDAVFDELMSERRTQSDVPLPDVAELYEFLQGLHTGMNVNPRFIPAPEVVPAFKRTSLTHIHPTERTDMIPGTFEHTKEMALYSTFSIPLIHGWLPSKDDAVHEAFTRHAVSYEDAQNLLFREEELEEKLCSPQGLTLEEQQLYQDILTIKSFLSISATQLTKVGLDVIKKTMKPGSVAILFRNDHFSTLYRHPQTLELLTLVTDAGYAGHAEVVWESLVDINGESAEFFSGDFRLVGGATHDHLRPLHDTVPENWTGAAPDGDNSEWTTVQSRRGRSHTARHSSSTEPPLSPKHEQEDRDLALALQLQEEEDERARVEQDRRRRESLLSEQYIEQQGRYGPTSAVASPRGGRAGAAGGPARARGAAASRSTTSLTSTASSSNTGRRGPTPIQPGATRPALSSGSSINVNAANTTTITTTTGNSGANAINRPPPGSRPTTQTVRSLLPPLRTTRPAAAAAAEDGLEDAPPSYEQAAKQLPYVPPAGHPSHPTSRPLDLAAAAEGEGGGSGFGSGTGGGRAGVGPPGSVGGIGAGGSGRPPGGGFGGDARRFRIEIMRPSLSHSGTKGGYRQASTGPESVPSHSYPDPSVVNRTIATKEELQLHYFSQPPQLGDINVEEEVSAEARTLQGYQALCYEVGLDPSDSIAECKRCLKKTLVNIIALVDARMTGKRVKVWDSFEEFRAYALRDENRIDIHEAKDTSRVPSLLRRLLGPRSRKKCGIPQGILEVALGHITNRWD